MVHHQLVGTSMPESLVFLRSLVVPVLGLMAIAFAHAATAQEFTGSAEDLPPFAPRGADTCLACHADDPKVTAIFKTPHAASTDGRTPFANLQCDACHGPGQDHSRRLRPGQDRPPVFAFGRDSRMSREEENEVCLSCHRIQGRTHTHWFGSTHQRQDVACVDCHQIHMEQDQVRTARGQAQVCYGCHTKVRAQGLRPSTHPIRQGLMSCSGCHEPHGTLTDAMLVRPTLNETCYTCHAEKRGPFLWEHAPATESCANCHESHGSIHAGLLNRRAPQLCQQCHSRAGHPSIAQSGDRLPGGSPSAFLLAGSCTNCHSQVHGSNHPSGANLSR